MSPRRPAPIETTRVSAAARGSEPGDLVLAIGNGQFLSHRITTREIVIGRDPACELVIDHPSLSRRHAVIRIASPITIQDLGSTNGTKVASSTLRGGEPVEVDQGGFRIGPYSFVLGSRRAGPSVSASGREILEVDDPTRQGASPMVRSFAAHDLNILITGETGVGKEVLAATIHELSGRPGPFLQINCATLSDTLLESELFGHERGAFTGASERKRGLLEAAERGTVLLDEIGELAPGMQAKLLRVIECREVLRVGATKAIPIDVRFVAATNRELAGEVDRGAFRADLFYRLDGVTLTIPPLRERAGSIVPLAIQFFEAARGSRTVALTPEVVAALHAHAWPGNVRELKAVIERAAVLAGDRPLAVRHLVFTRAASGSQPPPASSAGAPSELDAEQLADRALVLRALADAAGNQTRAAKQLGISRTTMITKLRIYKIPRPSSR